MSKLKEVAANGKIILLVGVVLGSFFFSSLGWRHVESTEETRCLVAALILVLVYALMVFELLDRNLAALIGAGASVAAHHCLVEFVSMERLLDWLDLETLSLLFGMMIIVSVLADSGLFDYLAVMAYKQSRGHFWLLISMMALITGLLSALVDNVSTMLLLSPTLIKLSQLERVDPRYVLMIMVLVCNIGGCATPVGDPPNLIIIGDPLIGQLGIQFQSFTGYCAPGALLAIVCLLLYLKLRYKSKESFRLVSPTEQDLHPDSESGSDLDSGSGSGSGQLGKVVTGTAAATMEAPQPAVERKSSRLDGEEIERLLHEHRIKDWRTLCESLLVLGATIFLFFLQSHLTNRQDQVGPKLTLGWVSLFAGLTLLVLNSRKGSRDGFERIIMSIEWSTLMFFFALFITMEAMSKLGLIRFLGAQIEGLIGRLPAGCWRDIGAITIVLWSSGLVSACIDNVPFTSMMIKVLATLVVAAREGRGAVGTEAGPLRALVFALSFGACFGGNGTLIGASANLITAAVSNRLGYPITFKQFFKFAAPATVLSLLVANLYLVVVFVWLDL